MMTRRCVMVHLSAVLIGLAPATATAQAKLKPLVIFAATSLKQPVDHATAAWVDETGRPAPKIVYGPSRDLARRIIKGERADVFLSGDLASMAQLIDGNLIKWATRVNFLVDRLALVARSDSTATVSLEPGVDLMAAIGRGRLAVANVGATQAGRYSKGALQRLGGWDKVEARIAQAENSRAALGLVSRGEAALGIVTTSDAAADPTVKVLAIFPEATHAPIIHPIAVLKHSSNHDAEALLIHLRSAGPVAAFTKQGFIVQ